MRVDRPPADGEVSDWDLAIDSGALDWIFNGELAARGYSPADLETTARVLSRVCPHCEAGVGEWCHNTGSGTVFDDIDDQHSSRRNPWLQSK